MSGAATLLLLASSSISAGAGGVYACSGGSFDVTKFDLKTCNVSVFKKALKKVSKDLDVPETTVTTLLEDDTPIDWGAEAKAEPKAEPKAGPKAKPKPAKTQAQIQAEKEAAAREAERTRLLKMPPNTIDRKPGIVKGVEIQSDPSWVNASPEDCWGIVKDQDAYGAVVGWGHRNDTHLDPKLRNSCFVYTRKEDGTGMPPFKGDPSDKINISGCHKPGLKLSEGCMTDDEKKYFERLKRVPPKNIDTVFGQPKGVKIESDPSWAGMSAEDCFKLASEAGLESGVRAWGYRTSDYKDKKLRNTCFLYRDGDFTKFKGTNDKTIITGCVGPGMKTSSGCVSAEEIAQEIKSTSKMQKALAVAAMAAKIAEQLAKQAVAKVGKAAKAAANAVKNAAKRTARQAARKTVQAAKAAANAAKKAAVAAANAVKNAAVNAAKKAVAAAKVAARAAKQAATQVARAAAAAARKAADAAKKAAKAAADAAKKAAKAATDAAEKAANAVANVANQAGKALDKAFCFSPNTRVRSECGELVCMKDLKLGDVLVGGIIVDATMQIRNRSKDPYYKIHSKELDDYIYVTGSHYIKHGDKYVKVCDFPESIRTDDHSEILSCLVTSTHKIPIGEYTFWDWEDNLVPQSY